MSFGGEIAIAYLIAGVLFIRSLAGLSKQATASRGNVSGMLGMALAVVVTAVVWVGAHQDLPVIGLSLLVGAIVIGGGVGAFSPGASR